MRRTSKRLRSNAPMNASPRAEIDAAIRAASRVFVLATKWHRTRHVNGTAMAKAKNAVDSISYELERGGAGNGANPAADAANAVCTLASKIAYNIEELRFYSLDAAKDIAELRDELASLGVDVVALERKAGLHPNSRRRTSRRLRANAQNETREIKVYYEIVTPESAEEGDFAETGELEPIVLTHDDLDEDEPSWVDAAVRAISDNAGALEADAYGRGAVPSWFIEIDGSTDYRTGANTRRSFIPKGFTPEEMVEMGRRLTGRHR